MPPPCLIVGLRHYVIVLFSVCLLIAPSVTDINLKLGFIHHEILVILRPPQVLDSSPEKWFRKYYSLTFCILLIGVLCSILEKTILYL